MASVRDAPTPAPRATDGARRAEILDTAADLFASAGIRTSLKDIADACGILPGSLYHHFDSKEAIIAELVDRYQADLDGIAEQALLELQRPDPRPAADRIVALASETAACGVRNRAALLLTLYEPSANGDEAPDRRATIRHAMVETLVAAQAEHAIRPGIDVGMLADRLCESMLHVGIGVSHQGPDAAQVPALRCRILLHGVAVDAPDDAALDRSPAMQAARRVIATWDDVDPDEDERVTQLKSVSRAEFGRRGYEATTVRDIASAAGFSTGSVYRLVGSKDELLVSIMQAFTEKIAAGWRSVLDSDSAPVEKLDALLWTNINALLRFNEELNIQMAWLRQAPPSSPDLGGVFSSTLRDLKSLLAEGTRAGDLELTGGSADTRARCLYEVVWTPGSVVRARGIDAAFELARATVLRGALEPSATAPR